MSNVDYIVFGGIAVPVGTGFGVGGPQLYDVRKYGATGNALYQSPVNGRWYQDAGLFAEATDDAAGFRAAGAAAATSPTGGAIFIPSGNWYFKSQVGGGPNGEFVVPTSNTVWYGVGDSSAIRLAPGLNTVANGGYAAVFGQLSTTSAINNVTFCNFLVDNNSAFNQWPGSAYGGVANPQNSAVMITVGQNVIIDRVNVKNANGVFVFLLGSYGGPESLQDFRLTDCRLTHIADDPNIGDASHVAISGTNGTASGLVIDWGGASNLAWHSSGATPTSAIEIHGFNTELSNLSITGFNTTANVAADSYDMGNVQIGRLVSSQCNNGITLFQESGHAMRSVEISSCIISINGGAGAGIQTANNATLSQPQGLGIFDLKIHDNTFVQTGAPSGTSIGIGVLSDSGGGRFTPAPRAGSHLYAQSDIYQPATPNGFYYICSSTGTSASGLPGFTTTLGLSYVDGTATFYCAGVATGGVVTTGSGIEIYNNKVSGFGTIGIQIATKSPIHSGNQIVDAVVRDNFIYRCGTFGIQLAGSSGDVVADFTRAFVRNNIIVDDRGGSSVLSYGVWVTAWTDYTSIIDDSNSVIGAITGTVGFDVASYPSLGHTYLAGTFTTINGEQNGIGVNPTASADLINTTNATSGVPAQFSPSLQWTGSAWTGSASSVSAWQAYVSPSSTNPAWVLTYSQAGGSFLLACQIVEYTGSNVVGVTYGASELLFDQSSLGSIHMRYQSGSGFYVEDGSSSTVPLQVVGTAISTASGTTIGLFGASPVAQAARVGQLTDSTGGTPSSTLASVPGGYSQSELANALASLAAKINALETIIHNIGASS